ncbi:MAG: hypothetical protein R3D52_05030 [Xanthobacteraceae bacterium]
MTSRATPVALPVDESASKTVEQQEKSDLPAAENPPACGPV